MQSTSGYPGFKSMLETSSQESSGRGSSSSGSSKVHFPPCSEEYTCSFLHCIVVIVPLQVWSSCPATATPPREGCSSARESPDEGIQTDSGTDVWDSSASDKPAPYIAPKQVSVTLCWIHQSTSFSGLWDLVFIQYCEAYTVCRAQTVHSRLYTVRYKCSICDSKLKSKTKLNFIYKFCTSQSVGFMCSVINEFVENSSNIPVHKRVIL